MKKKQVFFTKVALPNSELRIDYQQSTLFLGSCFAEYMAMHLKESKFNVIVNPFGIVYNPISMLKGLKRVFKGKTYVVDELKAHNNKYFSFDHHTSFSNLNKDVCLKKINEGLLLAARELKNTKTIVITLGSAWVYEYENFGIVANCHKIPNKQFTKRLLSVKELLMAFEGVKKELSIYNVIFTVSPVRHVKEGLHKNNLSKATLLLAINNLVAQNVNYSYFPAYEIVIDELRDYRFYTTDLVHPTAMAIDYVWIKFITTYCNEETIELMDEVEKIKTAIKHKPFNFDSKEHQQFIRNQISDMDKLVMKYPFLDFSEEKIQIKEGA